MATTSTMYSFFEKLLWGSSAHEQPVHAEGTFPPMGSVVVINGCPQAATLSFNSTKGSQEKHFGTKHVSEDTLVMGVVGGIGCPSVAASASRELMDCARDMLQKDQCYRLSGMAMFSVLSSAACICRSVRTARGTPSQLCCAQSSFGYMPWKLNI